MPSPAPEAKRARPKPKPRLKTGIAAPSATSVPSTLGPSQQGLTVDLTSSSPVPARSRPSNVTPKKGRLANGSGSSDDDAPSWVVGSHRLDDDVEIVETSAQARKRQRAMNTSAIKLDGDEDPATLEERRRRKEEEEERERLAEEEWMAQARRTVRHVPAASSAAKGKGKEPSPRASSPVLADGELDLDDDDDTDAESASGHKEDEGEFSARNMRRYKRKNQGKHRWMEQTVAAAATLLDGSNSSSSDSDRTPKKKRSKTGPNGKKPVRRARNSLTPPPPVAEAILQHVENRVHGALDADIPNPLLKDANRRAASDDDDGIDYFGTAAPARAPTPASPVQPKPQLVPIAAFGPIELGDSDDDDDDEIQATFVSGPAAAGTGAGGPSRESSRATTSHTRSPSVTAGPSKTHRNPLMFGAPDEVRISLVIRSHLDKAKTNQAAIDYLERPMMFKVNRWEPIKTLIQEAEKAKKYEAGSLVVTKDDARVYASTNPETLGFYSSGELVGYRRDVYETHKRRQEAERQQQNFLDAQAATAAAAAVGTGRASSSPVASTSALPRLGGAAVVGQAVANGGASASFVSASQPDDGGDSDGGGPAVSAALKVTMRGKGGTEVKLLVKPTQTIGQMLAHYAKKLALGPAEAARLRAEWDGEELARALTVGQSDMEDGDLLEIVGP